MSNVMLKTAAKLLLCIFFPLVTSAQETGIRFTKGGDWNRIVKRAKKENKYIFLNANTSRNKAGKAMESDVFTQHDVGELVNQNFISLQMQMDRDINDSNEIKRWYEDANRIKVAYKVTTYPSYLFFTPSGKIVHRGSGAKNKDEFMELIRRALNPEDQVYSLLENWKRGRKNYIKMLELYRFVQQNGSRELRDSIGRDYKAYLDGLSESELLTKDRIGFLYLLNKFVSSKDLIFNLALKSPEKLDQVYGKAIAAELRDLVITNEEIVSKTTATDGTLVKDPDWTGYQKSIAIKYPSVDALKLVSRQKIKFYLKVKDWKSYADSNEEYFKNYSGGFNKSEAFSKINTAAWDIFQFSMDRTLLQRALLWIDRGIELSPDNLQILDTKANLLYKLGMKEEAIALEERAYITDQQNVEKYGPGSSIDYLKPTLEKMKRGEPTWEIKAN